MPATSLIERYRGIERHRTFLGASALLFIASVAITIRSCRSMSGGMPMPGEWTMSMAWMRMPGQGWPGAAASFMGMWVVMMAAMMLPALIPALLRYRRALSELGTSHLNALAVVAGAGYFLVWAVLGAIVYPVGVFLANAGMASAVLARAMPVTAGIVLLLAGGLQLTAWKARMLCRCRTEPASCGALSQDLRGAWRHGLHLGADCALCCSGLMAVLLVIGVMNLGAMALVTAAITAERLLPQPDWTARAAGLVIVAAAVLTIGRALSAM